MEPLATSPITLNHTWITTAFLAHAVLLKSYSPVAIAIESFRNSIGFYMHIHFLWTPYLIEKASSFIRIIITNYDFYEISILA